MTVDDHDFIQTANKNFELDKINQNLIFTSQNAVKSVLESPGCGLLKRHPVFCVGSRTKELLGQSGYDVTVDTDYAGDLAEIISLVHADESFTFFCGNLRRDILPQTLKENGIAFNEIEVYETSITPHRLKFKPDGILFFSPSGVESYLKNNQIKEATCFCIGETTAEALEHHTERIVIAREPSIENVIDDTIQYYSADR